MIHKNMARTGGSEPIELASANEQDWLLFLPVTPGMLTPVASGERDVIFLSAPLPEELLGRTVLLLELDQDDGSPAGATVATHADKSPAGVHVVGMCVAGDQEKFSEAAVASMDGSLAGEGDRLGMRVLIKSLVPIPQVAPPLRRVQDLNLFAARKSLFAARPPPSVGFTLAPIGGPGSGKYKATFRHTGGGALEKILTAHPVTARGGSFNLVAVEGGLIETEFQSPRPRDTAGAIAMKIIARLDDPNPPGIDACAIM
mmetsp:Transcript_17974/g.56298  ORF Transcript_17974/g.56298 Transcript_17974/m.56298 type:complete len:258 (-) Transcript_17974:584-1357(-)